MSTSSHFTTDMEMMQTAARHVDEVATQIDNSLRRLNENITPITSTWSGAGSAAFQNLHLRWSENQTKLRQTLAEISQGLVENAQRYQAQEEAVVNSMTRQASNLN